MNDSPDQIALIREAIERATADDDLGEQGELLNELGLRLKEAGRFAEAQDAFEEALDIVDEFMEALHHARAQVLSNLGLLERDRGELDQAIGRYESARKDYDAINDEIGSAEMLVELGIIHKDASRLSEAAACLQQALTVLSPEAQPTRYASGLVGLGLVMEKRHEYQSARQPGGGDISGTRRALSTARVVGRIGRLPVSAGEAALETAWRIRPGPQEVRGGIPDLHQAEPTHASESRGVTI